MTDNQTIRIDHIRRDGGTQARAGLSSDTLAEYQQLVEDSNGTWPFNDAVTLFYDGTDYWLADGFHRTEASRLGRRVTVQADVKPGTRRDAILYAAGSNAAHGLRRTNDDKRRAALMLLNDPEWGQWSDREIARQCNVSNRFVSNLRKELSVNGSQMAETRMVSRNGQVYEMKTTNIGQALQDNAPYPPVVFRYLNERDYKSGNEEDEIEIVLQLHNSVKNHAPSFYYRKLEELYPVDTDAVINVRRWINQWYGKEAQHVPSARQSLYDEPEPEKADQGAVTPQTLEQLIGDCYADMRSYCRKNKLPLDEMAEHAYRYAPDFDPAQRYNVPVIQAAIEMIEADLKEYASEEDDDDAAAYWTQQEKEQPQTEPEPDTPPRQWIAYTTEKLGSDVVCPMCHEEGIVWRGDNYGQCTYCGNGVWSDGTHYAAPFVTFTPKPNKQYTINRALDALRATVSEVDHPENDTHALRSIWRDDKTPTGHMFRAVADLIDALAEQLS